MALVVLAVVAAVPARAAVVPSVRLVAASEHVTLHREGALVPLDLGVWVAATGGDFELRVTRPDYGMPRTIAQTDSATGDVLRSLPPVVLDGWRGLDRFITVTFRNARGTVVARRTFTFCPNAADRQRVGDLGPTLPTYPPFCGSRFPFLRGTVWGIDEHWAVSATAFSEEGKGVYGDEAGLSSARYVRIPNGRYSVTVRIAARYAALFAVPADDAGATLAVTVKTARHREADAARTRGEGDASGAPHDDVPTVTDPDPATLPDLVALPAWEIRLFHRNGRDFLAFAASPWNGGPGPLVVEGFRRPGESVMDAYQYFHDAQGNVVGRAPVGTFRYDPRRGHEHWHFLQFASFALLDAAGGEVVRSRKQAFCLAPTDAVDLTLERASRRPFALRLESVCGSPGSIWVRETLDAGWADTYYQGVPGQSFDVTKLPNGRYRLRVQVNPLGTLHETTTANDVETRVVYLRGEPGARRAVVAPWRGIAR